MSISISHIVLESFKDGDKNAFRKIFDVYKQKVFSYALKYALNYEDAEEIVQQVFVKLWDARKNIDPQERLDPYIYVITRNASLDFLKRISRDNALKRQFLRSYELVTNSVEDEMIFAEFEKIAMQAVESLPEKRKEIFFLNRMEGKSYDEIALQLGISKNTVKTQLLKANRYVKGYLRNYSDAVIALLAGCFLWQNIF